MKEKLGNPSVKKHILIAVLSIQVLVITNLAYSGLRTYSFILNGRSLVDKTTVYERFIDSDKSILVLGDSLAYGVGTSSPENSIAGQLADKFPNYSIINRSVVGYSTQDLADTINVLLQDDQYDIVVVMIGGNDIFRYGTDLNMSANNIRTVADAVSKQSDQTYIVTTPDFRNVSLIPWFSRTFYSSRSLQLHNAMVVIDDSFDTVSYIDTYDTDSDEYKSLEAQDGFHLNDLGITELVKLIVAAQEKRQLGHAVAQ